MTEMVTTTCTKCGGEMKLPAPVLALPADERICGRCIAKVIMAAIQEKLEEDGE